MKACEIPNSIRARCISPKRSSEVISHLVSELTYFYFVCKIPATISTNEIAGFHVPDPSRT